jgi:regulator of protease activity HflC (stomatin/prohibitin superfamily)
MFKKIGLGLGIIALSVTLTSCSKVPAGHRGVIVSLYGSEKGVADQSIGVGRLWVGWNQELYIFPTFLQNVAWKDDKAITMQTIEGLSIRTDAGITYLIQPENVTKVFQKYRLGIEEITDTFLHNMVRDAMNEVSSTMTVEQIYGASKEIFIQKVNTIVKAEANTNGIEVEKIYLVGSFELPPTVINSINSKIQASQNAMKVENEVATARAEAQKTIVNAEARGRQILINAESQAKANKILADSLTPEFVEYQKILRWDGKLPTMTGSAVPFVSVKA